jgi:anti-sigma-K factor RskA
MSPAEQEEPELSGDEAVAAEYVLGVLPAEERAVAALRIEDDAAFAQLVALWEQRLSPLGEAYREVTPPAALHEAIGNRLFGSSQQAAPARGLWQSLALWRGLSAAAVMALAVAVAVPLMAPPPGKPDGMLMTSMASTGGDISYLAMYDRASGQIGLSRVAGEPEAGRDFELWVIEGQNPPRSLGLIGPDETQRIAVTPDMSPMIDAGATFAISMEPSGGSPTGQPTGPVVASGSLRPM